MRVAVFLVALAAFASATDVTPIQDSRMCRQAVCDDADTFYANNCEDYQVVRKIFRAGAKHGDPCCPTFKCVQDPANPCGGKECPANTMEEAHENCNTLYKNDPIWNNLQPEFGAMYAVLKRPALDKQGRCCDEYRCRTNHTMLCEHLVAKTPCATPATCPLCHQMEVVEPADPKNGKCCDEVRCVPNPECLCEAKEATCPVPACDATYQVQNTANGLTAGQNLTLQSSVILYESDPYQGRCCDQFTCQNNLENICLAEQDRVGYNRDDLCSDCEVLHIIEEQDLPAGKCFPKYKCIPKPDHLCCGFNTTACPPMPIADGLCQSVETVVPSDEFVGPCCNKYAIVTNQTCVCEDIINNGEGCPYNAGEGALFMADNCPEVNNRGVPLYDVIEKDADPMTGKCCPSFDCVPTAQAQLRKIRLKKGKKAAKTTSSP
jgi:hypothetical protein